MPSKGRNCSERKAGVKLLFLFLCSPFCFPFCESVCCQTPPFAFFFLKKKPSSPHNYTLNVSPALLGVSPPLKTAGADPKNRLVWPAYVCLSVCLSVCRSVCLSVCLPACLSACLPASRSPSAPLSPFKWLTACASSTPPGPASDGAGQHFFGTIFSSSG